jgi:hypothetical protein
VDERLGQLHTLLHAGGVAADLAVTLLVEADVAQRLRRALAGRRTRQAAHPAEVGDQLGRAEVGRQAVVLRQVADARPHRRRVRRGVEPEHPYLAAGRRQQAQHDLDQCGLARAVGADQTHDARFDRNSQVGERRHAVPVRLGQRLGRN